MKLLRPWSSWISWGDLAVMTPPVEASASLWSWVGSQLWDRFDGPTAGGSLTFINSRHTFDTSGELTGDQLLVIPPSVFFIVAFVPQIR